MKTGRINKTAKCAETNQTQPQTHDTKQNGNDLIIFFFFHGTAAAGTQRKQNSKLTPLEREERSYLDRDRVEYIAYLYVCVWLML